LGRADNRHQRQAARAPAPSSRTSSKPSRARPYVCARVCVYVRACVRVKKERKKHNNTRHTHKSQQRQRSTNGEPSESIVSSSCRSGYSVRVLTLHYNGRSRSRFSVTGVRVVETLTDNIVRPTETVVAYSSPPRARYECGCCRCCSYTAVV